MMRYVSVCSHVCSPVDRLLTASNKTDLSCFFHVCRVNQDSLLRFSEASWQVWNLWALEVFASCSSDDYHPLGRIPQHEWQAEVQRIADIDDDKLRSAQEANLEEIRVLRDAAMAKYRSTTTGHRIDAALDDAEHLLKSYSVSVKHHAIMMVLRLVLLSMQILTCYLGRIDFNRCCTLLQGFYCVALKASKLEFKANVWAEFESDNICWGSAGLFDPRWHPSIVQRAKTVSGDQRNIEYLVNVF